LKTLNIVEDIRISQITVVSLSLDIIAYRTLLPTPMDLLPTPLDLVPRPLDDPAPTLEFARLNVFQCLLSAQHASYNFVSGKGKLWGWISARSVGVGIWIML
jgi:hypothetical protein